MNYLKNLIYFIFHYNSNILYNKIIKFLLILIHKYYIIKNHFCKNFLKKLVLKIIFKKQIYFIKIEMKTV